MQPEHSKKVHPSLLRYIHIWNPSRLKLIEPRTRLEQGESNFVGNLNPIIYGHRHLIIIVVVPCLFGKCPRRMIDGVWDWEGDVCSGWNRQIFSRRSHRILPLYSMPKAPTRRFQKILHVLCSHTALFFQFVVSEGSTIILGCVYLYEYVHYEPEPSHVFEKLIDKLFTGCTNW